ncbi:MAG TPA: TonB-dependent receptor [Usitatibacteraceae bacterium]|nr:TonB-dependent receptor [Usitatibacteraceae bacterium]
MHADRTSQRNALGPESVAGAVSLALGIVPALAWAAPVPEKDLLSLAPEDLLNVRVVAASRYEQKTSEVAGSPQVMTASDLSRAGVRSLAEALSLMGGIYLQNDGLYTRIGVRGFLRNSDYNARILLLLNGRRANELSYDGAYFGEEGPIDISLVERIEFIPGPGSSVYGSNALFGVINVVTKTAAQMKPAVQIDAHDRHAGRIEARAPFSWGDRATGVVQVSRHLDRGRRRDAAELGGAIPESLQSAGRDREWTNRLFAALDIGPYNLRAYSVNREVNVANGAYFSEPLAEPQPNRDRLTLVDVGREFRLAGNHVISARLGIGDYRFRGYYVPNTRLLGPGEPTLEIATSRWVDVELKCVVPWAAHSTLVAGVEVTRATSITDRLDETTTGHVLVDTRAALTRSGVFAQNDWTPWSALTASAGVRLDAQTGRDVVWSPRLGLVYRAASTLTLKAQHGVSFRAPNAYELYYNIPDYGYRTNPNLREEKIRSSELTMEAALGASASLRISAFDNRVDRLIDFRTDPADGTLVFSNVGTATTRGIQADWQYKAASGWQARAGLTWQRGRGIEAGAEKPLDSSPRVLAHLHLLTPSVRGVAGALYWRYVGPQFGHDGRNGGYALVDAALIAPNIWANWDANLRIANLLDRHFGYPLNDEFAQGMERGRGREISLGLRGRF